MNFCKIFLSMAVSLSITPVMKGEIVVTDSQSGEPLPMASIFDCKGHVVALTDEQGIVPGNIPTLSYPITVRYIGFENADIKFPVDTTVALREIDYELPELNVGIARRNLIRMEGYQRTFVEMTAGQDTVIALVESLVDFMLPRNKKAKFGGWTEPRILDSKVYAHVCRGGVTRDSIVSSKAFVFVTEGAFQSIDELVPPQELVEKGYKRKTVQGKYSPKETWQLSNDYFIVNVDALADYKDHIYSPSALKLLGFTTDMLKMNEIYRLSNNGTGTVNPEDIEMISFNGEMKTRGKMYRRLFKTKENFDIKVYSELYFYDREFLTDEEAKASKKNPPSRSVVSFTIPSGIPVLPADMASLKETITAKMADGKQKQ